jgi:hypothetical protein
MPLRKYIRGKTLVKLAITDAVLQGLASIKSDFASYDKPVLCLRRLNKVLFDRKHLVEAGNHERFGDWAVAVY